MPIKETLSTDLSHVYAVHRLFSLSVVWRRSGLDGLVSRLTMVDRTPVRLQRRNG